ncbi:MAG: hypothetical protein QGH61_09035 [Candidatus Marinimicrobia bacterium]|jgi:uncharacterized membrane protein|nr:hypothetical protein [Candidatus Neomarinimicrobiota bacterium]
MAPTYFALFYAVGIILFAVFVRFWLSKKRLQEEESKMKKTKSSFRVNEEMAKKISEDAKEHRLRRERDHG